MWTVITVMQFHLILHLQGPGNACKLWGSQKSSGCQLHVCVYFPVPFQTLNDLFQFTTLTPEYHRFLLTGLFISQGIRNKGIKICFLDEAFFSMHYAFFSFSLSLHYIYIFREAMLAHVFVLLFFWPYYAFFLL